MCLSTLQFAGLLASHLFDKNVPKIESNSFIGKALLREKNYRNMNLANAASQSISSSYVLFDGKIRFLYKSVRAVYHARFYDEAYVK